MGRKLKFAINKLSLRDRQLDSSQFALLEADVFASGDNAHRMPVSKETLKDKSTTIFNTPLLWEYDSFADDAGSHGKFEVPCGFVPDWSDIVFRETDDGRTMMTTNFLVWKKYSGKLLDIFSRDGKKSVSVEMEVFETSPSPDGEHEEITNFAFTGTTVLGTFVTPAISGAEASFIDFARAESSEYRNALQEFAKYGGVDFKIPDGVKRNCSRGLELHAKFGKGKPFNLATARLIGKSEELPYSRVLSIGRALRAAQKNISMETPEEDVVFINFMLLGAKEGVKWIASLETSMKEEDDRRMSYFEEGIMPYKSLEEINPALKGIKPSISLSQANAIAKQADAIGVDKEKNGWAIAIANFKKTHVVKDGKWVSKKDKDKFGVAGGDAGEGETKMPDIEKKQPEGEMAAQPVEGEMAAQPLAEGEMAAPPSQKDGEEEEEKEEQEEEEEEGESANMSNQEYVDVIALSAMLDKETEAFKAIASEMAKPQLERNYGAVAGGLFAALKKMAEDKDAYMKECAALKQYKAEQEEKARDFEIEKVLASVKEDLSQEELMAAQEEGKKFSLEALEGWKNAVRAKAFEAGKERIKSGGGDDLSVNVIGLPFADNTPKGKTLWG